MENDATLAKEGLLEPVLPGSETFDNSILAPLQNNYLYEESKGFFTYSSAHLINNATLQKRYSAFCAEKEEKGYSKKDLEESFGFLLFDDESTANKLADTGLMVGQGTCTTLGDSSKGVYISKYSDCLDLKRWYDGKTGYIVILKLTKGRVKEVAENYTQNFTRPTPGFDCHVSEQLRAVCTTTSSFLAFERTQYYMYELLDRGRKAAQCPRHVYPFAIVAFSYGKAAISDLELKEKSQEKKTSFHYQPWRGQLKIESVVYEVGLKSIHGAIFPANLSKTVKVDHAIGVCELRKTLPQAIFETSVVGEVSLDGRSFSLYDVVSLEARNDLSILTHELKEKDMALIICLEDGGFLILLHSSHFLSYEGAGTDKASTLQGMFIFPDSRSVPRETKRGHTKPKVSPETLQVLPALNYAESEMEKCPSNQQGEPLGTVEKHLQNFATLILPGLSSSPVREASMFPDQYDVPDGFPLIAPKWTEEAGARLKTYLKNPCGFQIPVARALELLAAGKQQRNDDHDDDVFYYISSPEEAPQTPADTSLERDVMDEADHVSGSNSVSDEVKATDQEQTENQKDVAAELSYSALPKEGGTPGTVVVATSDIPCERTDPSPKSGDLAEHCDDAVTDSENMSQSASDQIAPNDECSEGPEAISKETTVETTSVPLLESGTDFSAVASKASPPCEAEAEGHTSEKEDCRSDVPPKEEGQIPVEDKELPKEAGLSTSISVPTPSENQTEAVVEDCKKVQPQENSDILPQTKRNLASRRGKRKKRGLRRNVKIGETPASAESTSLPSCSPVDATPEQSGNSEMVCSSSSDLPKRDWRSLPRRKRFWNVDFSLKRVLRSDAKTETESSVEESPSITDSSVTENIITSTPKRKMEGFSMRERYGLKTIITECGRVFVPHGSEVATGDMKSKEDSQDSSLVTTSPADDKLADTPITPSPSNHLQDIPMNTPVKALSPQQITEKDTTSHNNSGQSLDSDPKKSKPKESVYKAISISKLKTVLKRAKRSRDNGKSASDNAEPELKKGRSNTDVDLTPDNAKLSPCKDTKGKTSSALQKDLELADEQDPSKSSQFKQDHVSWRELNTSSSQENLMPKENGCINFDISASKEIVKQADQQLVAAFTEDRVGGKGISSVGKSSKEVLATGVSLPSDALNLLADLALSANSDKMLHFSAKPRQETLVGAKTSISPESVLHTLLRGSSAKLKLPPKSPFPEGLVVPGDLMLEITKEHSYSQPTSLLPGLSGACPQAPPPAGCVESLLSLSPKLQLRLPEHSSGAICPDKGGKNGWRHLSLDVPFPSTLKAKKPRFLHQRRIIEKGGLIQVGRLWRESYDFTFDSRFTNDRLEKSVTRALHGKWDFNIEDTYEQVHLIFHMWIGLFYSKPTSRFFHFDHNSTLLERKEPPKVPDVTSPVQASPPVCDAGLSSKEDGASPLRPVLDILDLSVKASGPPDQCIVSQGTSGESPKTSSDTGSRVEQTMESKEPADGTSSSHSSKVPIKSSAVNYRSTGHLVEESSASDYDYNDMDNDAGTESSYTELLENNSAYSNLCEQASNMHIGEQKCLKVQKTVPCKDQGVPEALRIRNPVRTASGKGTNFDAKAVAVFHQVVRSVGPVILSKAHDQASERKIILSSLNFKDKTGDGAPESRCSESVSKDKDEIALPGKNVLSGNNKDESALKTLEAGSSASSMAVCTENDNTEMEVKSVLVRRDDTSISISKANDSTKEKVNDDTPVSADMHSVIDGSDKARKEVEPMSVDKPTDGSRNDATERINTKSNEKERPVAEVREETLVVRGDISGHDMKNEIPHGVSNMNDERMLKDGVKPVHDVNDGELVDVQNGNDNAKDGVKTACDIGDGTPVKDVNDQTKEEARPSTSVSERHDDKMEGMEVHDVIDAGDIRETLPEKSEKSACEEITGESNESEKREGAQIICDDTNSKKDSEQKIVESHASALDLADSVGMKICDEKKLEDETQANVNEVNVSGGEAGVEDIVKLSEGEIRTETSVVRNDSEHIGDVAQLEVTPDSSADCLSLSAQQFMKMKEDQSSPAVGATCPPTENNSESAVLSPVVQNETPVINQADPRKACSDVPPCTAVTNTEPSIINESSHWDSTKVADDSAILKATLTKEVDSSKDVKSQKKDTNQNRLTFTISKASVYKTSEIQNDSDSQDMSPPALQIDMEHELNSRSCTPTQDEQPYDYKACEDLQDNHSFERELHPVNRSPTVKGSAPDRSVCPLSCSEKHICNSPGHRAQSFPQDTSWSAETFDTTVKVTDKSESPVISEHVPKQNLRHFDHVDVTPPRHLYSKESQLQKEQFGHLSEEYEDQSSKLVSSWMHEASFKTELPDMLRERFACDEDAAGPLIHFRNNTSIHRELAQMPREATDGGSDGWVRHFRYADSESAVDESQERVFPFRHQADLSLSESYDTDSVRHSRKKLKRTFYQDTWDQEGFEGTTEYSIKKTFSCGADRTKTLRTVTSSSYQHKGNRKQSFDWRRYFRREGIFNTSDENDRFAQDPPSSIITVFDKKGNRAIFENMSTLKRSVGTHGLNLTVEDPLHNWEDQRSKPDITQSLMEVEYLIFSEKMNQMLKNCKAGAIAKTQHRANLNPAENPMTVHFSKLDEQEGSVPFDETWPNHTKLKINVDMSERKVVRETVNYGKPLHLQSLFCERGDEAACTKISDITKECVKSYNTMMNDVCTGKTTLRQHDKTKRKRDGESAASSSKQSAFCGRIKKAMFDNLHDNLNSIVRQACKIKYRFYILVTSADPFFEETKDLLEAEGHTAVEPYQFDFDDNDQIPLLIILRNEDIAEHICDVPHLLDLKKSSRVLFAGIDQPDDVVNLTHQELFAKGGFVVFDDTALDTLTLENMKKVVGIMEELDKKGKWKWFLHYRDSRKLRENARCSPEAQTKKHFVDCCQEAGIVEVLPYHECDVISRDRPDYLRCLVRLQIQNASARFPVFITDTPAETFGKNGILTMNIYTFSRILSNDTCSVS